jgi:hypothetical protein
MPIPVNVPFCSTTPSRTVWALPGDTRRALLEGCVARAYMQHYGAVITHFHERLLGVVDDFGSLQGVIGWTPAVRGPMFLEQYSSTPVEAQVEERTGVCTSRAAFVEVGNLSASTPGSARALMTTLAQHLRACGFGYATLTATAGVRKLLDRLGADLLDLCDARGTAEGIDRVAWGSYYDHDPRVVVLDLVAFCAGLERARERSPRLRPIWREAQRAAVTLGPLGRAG